MTDHAEQNNAFIVEQMNAENVAKAVYHETSHTTHEEEEAEAEVPNLITVLSKSSLRDTPTLQLLNYFENSFFSLLVVILLSAIAIVGSRKKRMIPGRLQNVIEFFIEAYRNLVFDILGEKNGRRFLPYVGTLFVFILCNNLFGLIPFMKSPTSSYVTTGALGILTFLYVQFVAIKDNGIIGYLYHLAGSPKEAVMWCLSPLFFVLHVIGELVKPISLSLRLFGNILGEDTLISVFALLGVMIVGAVGLHSIPMGLPLQLPFFFLAVIGSTIQALIFSVLTTIYFLMVLPEDEEGH